MRLQAYAERLDLGLRLQLLKPGDSLKRASGRDLPAELKGPSPATAGWWQRQLKWAILPVQAALFLLAFFGQRNWPLSRVTLPTGNVSDASITSLWSVEATLFGLIAALTPLVIASASDRFDRTRMIRRFRQDVFNWFVTLGLFTLSLMFLAEFFWKPLPKERGTSVWLLGSFLVLLAALFYTIRYTYTIVMMSPRRKFDWVLEEAEDYFRATLVERYALAWLRWPHKQEARKRPTPPRLAQRLAQSKYVTFELDVRGLDSKTKAQSLISVPMMLDGKPYVDVAYIKDISLGRLDKWLQSVAPQGCAIRQLWLAGAPNHSVKPLAPIAVAETDRGQPALVRESLEKVSQAYLVGKPPQVYFRQAMKDLRDRAAMAARNGQVAEFETLLESISDLVVTFYCLATKLEEAVEKKLDILAEQREAELTYLEPRTALRAVLHELGEEVFVTDSPDVIKAWLHEPHRILESTRGFPIRVEPALMYPWFRAANLIRGQRGDIVEKLDLILESLQRRLLTYGRELMAAMLLSGTTPGTSSEPSAIPLLRREFEWYLRIIGKLLSVIDAPRRTDFMRAVEEVLRVDRADKEECQLRSATIWIECARHLVADYLNKKGTIGLTQNSAELCMALREIRDDRVNTIDCLIFCWCRLLKTQEPAERMMSQLYDQLIDLTWEEQTELLQGIIGSPISRHRGKAAIVWLARQLQNVRSAKALTADEEHVLSDLIRGDREIDEDLEALPCKMEIKPMKTFAYGSNLCWQRLRDPQRVPSAIPVAKAYIDDWSLEISKHSTKDGSGKANIIRKVGAQVWGVIYEFDAKERPQLDREEGGYSADSWTIVDWQGVSHSGVLVYTANERWTNLEAYDWYKAYIVAGARQHEFPEAYQRVLKSLPKRRDPDVERQGQNQIAGCGGRPPYLQNSPLVPTTMEVKEEERLIKSTAPTNGDRHDPRPTPVTKETSYP
jgi:AIG2 family protein